ncbi:MAG TPA: ankyrin repeat domain-containing protein [Thermoanaerobaculia bacterium]|nr:ankyrin repeat domain-containing protein [Thermoanaerobaculia bacterium]
MKRAVIIGFLTWAAFAAGYYVLLRGHMRYALPAAIGAGLFMATVAGTVRISIDDLRNARWLSIDSEPRDGETFAATGPIRVDGEPLRAPFSRRAAAFYIYEIDRDVRGSSVKDYSGFALAPSYVDAFHGPVRLAGFPRLENFEKTVVADAGPYVAATQFARAGLDVVRQMLTGAEERERKDFQLTDAGVTDESRAFEQVVEPGEIVCAIGRYENGRIVSPRIVRGAPDNAAAALRWKAKQQFITATAIAIGVNIFVALPFFLSSATAKTQPKKTSFDAMYQYHDAVRRGDLAAAQRMVANGIPVNVPDLEGKQPLAIAHDEATAAWLIANGADVNAADEHGQTVLMEQCTYGHAGVVKLLIAKGARLDDVDPRYHMSALKQAEQYQYMNIVQILRDAGAHDDTVTEANGKPLGDDDEPVRVAAAYLDALFANDPKAMGALWVAGNQAFDEYDLKQWRGARPHPAHLVRGFANDAAATLELRGKTPGGGNVTWRYDLARVNGAWKLRDEVWETRFNGVE